MVIGCLVDFWSGVSTAKALGEKVNTHGFRRTIVKIGDYIKVMLFTLMFDMLGSLLSYYTLPFATILGTVAVMWIEGKSVIENSRRKHAHAADIPEAIKEIIHAATAQQAAEVLKKIVNIEKHEDSSL